MCVIFFYVNSNPIPGGYKLILASNRDEFYARETQDASKWANKEHVYGGIDLQSGRKGGTWLAVGGHGGVFKIGALLNLTGEPKPKNAVGRGMIVTDFVVSTDECNIQTYNSELLADCKKYSPFNFVSIEIGAPETPASISLLSNIPPNLEHFVEDKCYGFGNSLPAVPFQKVINGHKRFENIIKEFNGKLPTSKESLTNQNSEFELVESLKNLLKCKHKFWPDAELQRRSPNWGEHLSALNVNISDAGYGSRTHSVILIDEHNEMHFYEDTMAGLDPEGEWRQTYIEKQFFQRRNSNIVKL